MLAEPCTALKGLNLKADLPAGCVQSVAAGELLAQQTLPCFARNIDRHGLDAGMAILGAGAAIRGQGELLRIVLEGEFDPEDVVITARNTANKELGYAIEAVTVVPDIPTHYAVSANYPNPFRPMTNIDFALPEPQHVKLMVFGIDGRRVATLKNESMAPGRYTVTWLGTDDRGEPVPAGIYFYRIQAGDFSRIRKMALLK
jgi:hypothetical protein